MVWLMVLLDVFNRWLWLMALMMVLLEALMMVLLDGFNQRFPADCFTR
jgi:hypothetical protein